MEWNAGLNSGHLEIESPPQLVARLSCKKTLLKFHILFMLMSSDEIIEMNLIITSQKNERLLILGARFLIIIFSMLLS